MNKKCLMKAIPTAVVLLFLAATAIAGLIYFIRWSTAYAVEAAIYITGSTGFSSALLAGGIWLAVIGFPFLVYACYRDCVLAQQKEKPRE